MDNGIERSIRVFIGDLDARGERIARGAVAAVVDGVDELDDVVVAEGVAQGDLLRIGERTRGERGTDGGRRPIAPRARVCGRIEGIEIAPCCGKVGVGTVGAVVIGIIAAADKARKHTGAVTGNAVVADTVHQDPTVRTDDDGHTALIIRGRLEERGGRVEIAQRDTDVGIVPDARIGQVVVLRRAIERDGHALTDGACGHRVDDGLVIALIDGAEGREKFQIALGRIVGGAAVEVALRADDDGLILAFAEFEHGLGSAALAACRTRLVGLAERVVDADVERVGERNALFAAVKLVGRHELRRRKIVADGVPIDFAEVVGQDVAFDDLHARLTGNGDLHVEIACCLLHQRGTSCIVCCCRNFGIGQRDGSGIRLEPYARDLAFRLGRSFRIFIRILRLLRRAGKQTQRHHERK